MLTAWVPRKQLLTHTHPVLNHRLALPQPFCAWKGLLNLARGPDAAQVEGHSLSSDVPYPEAFNPAKTPNDFHEFCNKELGKV